MKLTNLVKHTAFAATFIAATALMSGCGGVSEAQMNELSAARGDSSSLQAKANALKEQRTQLEREIAEKNAKLQQCNKEKQEIRANLDKLPK